MKKYRIWQKSNVMAFKIYDFIVKATLSLNKSEGIKL